MPSRRSFLKSGLATAALTVSRRSSASGEAVSPAINAGANDLTLFAFDDHSIPWRDNLKLTLVQATKHPVNPVLRCGPEGSPDGVSATIYGTVLQIDGRFRMWYLANPNKRRSEKPPTLRRSMCYAESDDGIHWTKPELGLVEFNGSTRNNICRIESDPASLSGVDDFISVLYEPGDPDPSRRYKLAFISHPPFNEVRGGRSKIGPQVGWNASVTATSADGWSWKVAGDRPMNSGGEPFEVSGLVRFKGFYYATGQLFSPWTWQPDGRAVDNVMLVYRSPDFIRWSRSHAFAFARSGQLLGTPIYGQRTHMGAGLWNRGNVLIGLFGQWQDGPPDNSKGLEAYRNVRIDLGLMLSNDGIHFREPVTDFKVIPRGEKGEWDAFCVLQGSAFANAGEQTYIWYSHWDPEFLNRSEEVGLATLRRDGFGYLSRKFREAPGHAVTDLLIAQPGAKLHVNIDEVSPDAPFTVELLDAKDEPIAGFSGSEAVRITSPGVRQAISWPQPLPPRFAVKLSFPENGEARLYALYLSHEGT